MKKAETRRILHITAAAVLAAAVMVLCIWHRAARAVWSNLTGPKISMEESTEWDGGTSYIRVPYAADSESQYLDLYVPDMEGETLPKLFVIIHGGGFVANDSQSRQAQLMYRYFRDRGWACATVNYRLAQEEPFPGGLSDCKAAIRFLRAHAQEYGFDAGKIAVFGESAGGYLAVMCAVTNDEQFMDVQYIGQEIAGDVSAGVNVLVDYYGHIDKTGSEEDWQVLGIPKLVRDIANSWISGDILQGYEDVDSFWHRKNISGMTAEELAEADPHHYIAVNDLKGLSAWILHGDADITVPYLHSERLAQALEDRIGKGNIYYELVPGAGHAGEQLYTDEMLEKLEAFMWERM